LLAVTNIATTKKAVAASVGIFLIPKNNIEYAVAPTRKRRIENKFRWFTPFPNIASASQIEPQSAPRSLFNLKNLNQPTGVVRMKGKFIINQVARVSAKYLTRV
jgi:hypothetical protein